MRRGGPPEHPVANTRITRYTDVVTKTPDTTIPTTTATPDWVGKVYIERSDYCNMQTGRMYKAPANCWRIVAVEPATRYDYEMTGADPTNPRFTVTLERPNSLGRIMRTERFLTVDAEVVEAP